MVTPQATVCPARYLGPDDRVLTVKAEAAANVMFVLCVYSPGPAILEIVNSINQNVCSSHTHPLTLFTRAPPLTLSHAPPSHTLTHAPPHIHTLTLPPLSSPSVASIR